MSDMINKEKIFEKSSLIILLGALTAFDPISIDMYLPAFQNIALDFSVKISTIEMSLSVFFVGLALGQLLYGPLADLYGRKKPLMMGMLIYSVASLGCSLSKNIQFFIFFRILQALGGCSGMVITRAIVSDVFEKKRAAHTYSTLMLIMGVSPILAPSIGGCLAKYFGWRFIFYTLTIFSLICTYYVYALLPETSVPNNSPVSNLNSSRYPILNYFKKYSKPFRDKTFLSYCLSGGFSRSAMFAYMAASPFIFISYFNLTPTQYGWLFGMNAVGIISASQINRFLIKHFAVEKIYTNVALIIVMFAFILLINSLFFRSFISIIIPLFALITSIGFIIPNSAALGLANQGTQAGLASALLGTIQWTIAFLASFLVSQFHNNTPVPMALIIFGCTLLSLFSLSLLHDFRLPSLRYIIGNKQFLAKEKSI